MLFYLGWCDVLLIEATLECRSSVASSESTGSYVHAGAGVDWRTQYSRGVNTQIEKQRGFWPVAFASCSRNPLTGCAENLSNMGRNIMTDESWVRAVLRG